MAVVPLNRHATVPLQTTVGTGEKTELAPARRVLLLGGDCSALGVARALRPLSVPIRFLPGPNRLAAYSRHLDVDHAWPGAEAEGALAHLEAIAARGKPGEWVLIPAGDSEVRLVTEHHERLSRQFRLATPPWDVTRYCGDKQLTYARAAELNLGHPHTYRLTDLATGKHTQLRYPLILKPAMKEGVNALTVDKAWTVATRDEFLAQFPRALELAGRGGLIVQEMIPDDGTNQYSYCAFCADGDPLVVMAARRTRQRPRKAGTGTFVETLPPQAFESEAAAFLRSLNYTGLVEMEFMRDPRDGRFKLIDVNPRIWTWHALGLPAGVNFAEAVWRHASGLPVPRARAMAGHSWIYALRDLSVAIADIREGKLNLGDYLRQLAGASSYAVFSGGDPIPAVVDVPLSLWRSFSRRRRATQQP